MYLLLTQAQMTEMTVESKHLANAAPTDYELRTTVYV